MEEKMTMKELLNRIDTQNLLMQKDLSYVRQTLDKLEQTLSADYVTKYQFQNLEVRVDKREQNETWIVRLIISLVITAVVGLVLTIR